jgi:hypothetical protein
MPIETRTAYSVSAEISRIRLARLDATSRDNAVLTRGRLRSRRPKPLPHTETCPVNIAKPAGDASAPTCAWKRSTCDRLIGQRIIVVLQARAGGAHSLAGKDAEVLM